MQLTLSQLLLVAYTGTVWGQGAYTQCGGTGWSGSTYCTGGYECICLNAWYSQCLPAGSAQSSCSGGSGGSGGSVQQTQPSPAAGGPAQFYNANPSNTMAVVSSPSPSSGSVPAVSGGSQATTTHYDISSQSACGCNGGWQSSAGPGIYAAAGTLNLFGTGRGGPTYCGTGCGSCFQLTSTGASPPGEGTSGQPTNSIIVMITDLCPAGGNTDWCSQPTNQYGYGTHFDIINPPSGWNNPVVNYAPIACPATLTTYFDSCKCANGGL